MKQKLTIISLDFWVDVAKNRWGHLFSLQDPKICCILRMTVTAQKMKFSI